jgi:hypothetical protein
VDEIAPVMNKKENKKPITLFIVEAAILYEAFNISPL